MNRTKSKFAGCILGLGLLLAGGQSAHATLAIWDNSFTPSAWARGTTSGSLYSEWNVFNDDIAGGNIQDTSPEIANFGGGTYQVAELIGSAFLTSGGNIYSPTTITAFDFTAGNLGGAPTDVRNVYLRIASLGSFDTTLNQSFTNFQLNGVAGTYTQLFNTAAGPGQGNEVEGLVTWLNVPNASLFHLNWNSVSSSVSLDQLSLDVGPVAPVPLPAAAYFMATGLVGLWTMARRKKHTA